MYQHSNVFYSEYMSKVEAEMLATQINQLFSSVIGYTDPNVAHVDYDPSEDPMYCYFVTIHHQDNR